MFRPSRRSLIKAAAAAGALAFARAIHAGQEFPRPGQAGKDVIWLPTPDDMVQRMLDLAQVFPGERLVDLGSGDGKIVIAAAKRGAVARGIEYNPEMVEHSRRLARQAGVNVELVQGDIFAADFSTADVVTMFLLESLNERLRPTLLAMKPGTRVVSYRFGMGDWEPDATSGGDSYDAYLWRVPVKIDGAWRITIGKQAGPTLRIEQRYQKIEGKSLWGNRAGPLHDAALRGPVVTFTAADPAGALLRFEGLADHGGPITGVVMPAIGGAPRLFVAERG